MMIELLSSILLNKIRNESNISILEYTKNFKYSFDQPYQCIGHSKDFLNGSFDLNDLLDKIQTNSVLLSRILTSFVDCSIVLFMVPYIVVILMYFSGTLILITKYLFKLKVS